MATPSIQSDEMSASSNQAANLIDEIEPVPSNLWYKNCRCCERKNVPFEQKNWTGCLLCTIDWRQDQIEGVFNPRNTAYRWAKPRREAYLKKLLNDYVELLGILRFSDTWQEVQPTVYWGLTEVMYDGKPQMRNWSGLRLTDKGKKALGRT